MGVASTHRASHRSLGSKSYEFVSIPPASMLLRFATTRLAQTAFRQCVRRSVPVLRSFSTMDTMESGTKTYMSLYPEGSTDGGK